MDIDEYIFNKLKEKMLNLLKEAIKRGEYVSSGNTSLTIDDAVASSAIKQLGGAIEEGIWVPPSKSILETIYERGETDEYYYLLSLENGEKFIIKLTLSTLEIAEELSDEALEVAFGNIMEILR